MLELESCKVCVADEAADLGSWQQVFPGPGRLPHLTSLMFTPWLEWGQELQHADIESVVSSCSSLQVLHLEILEDGFPSALTRLSGLTSLILAGANDEQCRAIAELTGLRELRVDRAYGVSAAGLRQLAALEHLTSLRLLDLGWPGVALRERMPDIMPGPYTTSCVITNKVRVGGRWDIVPQPCAPNLLLFWVVGQALASRLAPNLPLYRA